MQREALTYQFYSLGESPRLVSLTPSVELNVATRGFDRGSRCVCVEYALLERERNVCVKLSFICSVWEFVVEEVESLPTKVMVEVAGSGVLAVDCGIRSHMPHTKITVHT